MKLFVRALAAAALSLMLSAHAYAAPAPNVIPYPADYPTNADEDGADAFAGTLDDSGSIFYTAPDFWSMKSGGTLHLLERFRTYQQTTEATCGAASAVMVLDYFSGGAGSQLDEMSIFKLVSGDMEHGTSVEGLRDFFTGIGWRVEAHASVEPLFPDIETFIEYVTRSIDAGEPIMVDWVDWAGHWQVIIGIDTGKSDSPYDDTLILADPYDITDHKQDGYYTFPAGRFFDMWREGPCTANAIPYVQPFVKAVPDRTR